MISMLNFRKFAVFGLLFAAVLANTSSVKNDIRANFNDFKTLVTKAAADRTLLSDGHHKYQIEFLDQVDDDFKLRCLKQFETGYLDGPVAIGTPKHGYIALDRVCKNYVRDIMSTISTHKCELNSILNEGNIIEFLVRKNEANKNQKKIETEIKLLRNKYRDMEPDEAKIWLVVRLYDREKFADFYPQEKSSVSETVTTTSEDLVHIQERFVKFIDLIIKGAAKGTLPSDINKYQVGRLNEVKDDFKCRCLKAFDLRLNVEGERQKKYYIAVKALDRTCKNYVYDIMSTLLVAKIHSIDKEINSFLDSMLEKGDIIPFFADMNNPKQDKEKMETEIQLLTNKYKIMKPAEAHIWFILRDYEITYNKKIFGDCYPQTTPK